MALDRQGGSLNINADTAAAEIAIALRAFKLINLTDVDGVMNADRTMVYHRLTLPEAEAMISDGTIAGGMIPKLEGCMKAVRNGVTSAHVVNGNKEHNLLLELFTDEGVGTMITPKSFFHGRLPSPLHSRCRSSFISIRISKIFRTATGSIGSRRRG